MIENGDGAKTVALGSNFKLETMRRRAEAARKTIESWPAWQKFLEKNSKELNEERKKFEAAQEELKILQPQIESLEQEVASQQPVARVSESVVQPIQHVSSNPQIPLSQQPVARVSKSVAQPVQHILQKVASDPRDISTIWKNESPDTRSREQQIRDEITHLRKEIERMERQIKYARKYYEEMKADSLFHLDEKAFKSTELGIHLRTNPFYIADKKRHIEELEEELKRLEQS